MSSTAMMPAKTMPSMSAIEAVLAKGDLSKLTDEQRVDYLLKVCDALGISPLTQPLRFLTMEGKLVLYATKDCTEQLRKLHGVSVTDIATQRVDDIYVVLAKVQDKTGRTDASTGAVGVGTLKGNALANAIMKAETKAKRRATLSICGLGVLDETEIETIRGAVVPVHTEVSVTPLPLLDAAAEPAPEPAPEPPKPRTFRDCRLLKVTARTASNGFTTWADVEFAGVDEHGEEVTLTLPTAADSRDASLSVAEQLCQGNEKVAIHTKIGARNKKEAINKFERAREPGQDDVDPVPTATEIFGKDDVGF